MRKPEIESDGFEYTFSWPEKGCQVMVSEVRQDRDRLVAHVGVFSLVTNELLYEGPLNLSAGPRIRKELLNHVASRLAGRPAEQNPDFTLEMVDYVVAYVRQQSKETEAPTNLYEQAEIDPSEAGLEWVVPGLVPAGDPTLVFAHGESGKSLFAAFVSVVVSVGFPAAGFSPKRTPVLYLDYEGQERSNRLRMQAIARGLEMPKVPPVLYRRCTLPLGRELAELARIVRAKGIGLVVVDSFFGASEPQKDSATSVRDYFMDLRRFGCAVMTLDHVAKHQEGERSPYGSVYKQNFSRCVWELTRSDAEDQDGSFLVGLFCRKFNNGPRPRPVGLEISFNGEDPYRPTEIFVKRTDPMDDPEFSRRMPMVDRIERCLKGGKRTVSGLLSALDLETDRDRDRVRHLLRKYKGKRFLRIGDDEGGSYANEGEWGLLK